MHFRLKISSFLPLLSLSCVSEASSVVSIVPSFYFKVLFADQTPAGPYYYAWTRSTELRRLVQQDRLNVFRWSSNVGHGVSHAKIDNVWMLLEQPISASRERSTRWKLVPKPHSFVKLANHPVMHSRETKGIVHQLSQAETLEAMNTYKTAEEVRSELLSPKGYVLLPRVPPFPTPPLHIIEISS